MGFKEGKDSVRKLANNLAWHSAWFPIRFSVDRSIRFSVEGLVRNSIEEGEDGI